MILTLPGGGAGPRQSGVSVNLALWGCYVNPKEDSANLSNKRFNHAFAPSSDTISGRFKRRSIINAVATNTAQRRLNRHAQFYQRHGLLGG